jgi:hypothetical protein
MNCERLITADSTSYCVPSAISWWQLVSCSHGLMIEKVCNINKVCRTSCSQCRHSYHKISCAFICVLDQYPLS